MRHGKAYYIVHVCIWIAAIAALCIYFEMGPIKLAGQCIALAIFCCLRR